MKILIIQQKWIGDVLTCSILFKILKEELKDVTLDYLIDANTYPVVQNNPYIDNFILLQPGEGKSLSSLLKQGHKQIHKKYDVVIDALGKPSSNLLAKLSGAHKKISYKKWYSCFLYTHAVERKRKPRSNAGLAVENRLALLEPILLHPAKTIRPQIYLTDQEKEEARRYLQQHHLDFRRPIFMISVVGSKPNKSYPDAYTAQLLDWLVQTLPKAQLLFNYIPHQLPQVHAILEKCNPETRLNFHIDVYAQSLRFFMAIASHCQAVIGNEGGAINIGKALNIPTFSIFSPQISREDWQGFEDGIRNTSVHLAEYKPELYHQRSKKALKQKTALFYHKFHPSLFKEKYIAFLRQFA